MVIVWRLRGNIIRTEMTYNVSSGTLSLYTTYLEVKREYYQNCFVLRCVMQCSQSAAHLYEQFLQVQQIGFVTLRPLHCV